jgi:hypothetical protein
VKSVLALLLRRYSLLVRTEHETDSACSTHGSGEKCIHNAKRPLERPRCRWKDEVKMDLREIGLEDVDFIHLAQDSDHWRAVVNTVINLRLS